MKNVLRLLVGLVLLGGWAARAEDFSKTLTPAEFAAAGLDKLSPEELARLDALVQAQRSGEVAKVREETAAQVREETTVKVREETTARVREETAAKVRAEVAAEKPAHPPGVLDRVRVLLTPGTQIDYTKVETAIAGRFSGYEKGTIFTLANGQRWQVTEGSYWVPKKERDLPRKVVIEPGSMGSFFLKIEDGGRPRVKFVGRTDDDGAK